MSIASAAPAGRTRWATPSALSRRRTGTNCARWSDSSAAASSASGRKVSTIRPRRRRDRLKANVISNGDRIKAGRSSLVILLHRIARESRGIISIQAHPAAGGGSFYAGAWVASCMTRNTPKSPRRRRMIGKRNGRKIHTTVCNQSCCRWISGRHYLLLHNRIKTFASPLRLR